MKTRETVSLDINGKEGGFSYPHSVLPRIPVDPLINYIVDCNYTMSELHQIGYTIHKTISLLKLILS